MRPAKSRFENMVSVILPTFNESGSIVEIIKSIKDVLKGHKIEILVVDDNSPDGTYQKVEGLKDHTVRAFLREREPSLAKSIRKGIEEARGDRIVIMDSDFNHHPKYLDFFVKALNHYDCVSGSRFLYGGKGANKHRHLLSWAFNVFIRIICDGRITDNLFGYFAIKRETLESLNYNEIFWGFGDYSIRLLYFLQKKGASILQVPTLFGERIAGTSHGHVFQVFFSYTWEALKLVLKHGRIDFKPGNNVKLFAADDKTSAL